MKFDFSTMAGLPYPFNLDTIIFALLTYWQHDGKINHIISSVVAYSVAFTAICFV